MFSSRLHLPRHQSEQKGEGGLLRLATVERWQTRVGPFRRNGGDRNIEMALTLLQCYELPIKAKYFGGDGRRKLMLDIWIGDIWLKHQPLASGKKEANR